MSEQKLDKTAEPEPAAEPAVETVTLTIDGVEITVPKGTRIIEAARQAGNPVAAFCYHPGLEVVAVCRQCLVSVEGAPKLMPACQGVVANEMVVHTQDEASLDARRQILEYTLLNHPIDCPICDKAGECTLQKHYVNNNNQPSRFDVPKVHKSKVVDLGPHIVLDSERCILCTRCIRVCDEVVGEHQLEMSNRGNHSEICTAPGMALDNPYSLNTVDVCPVGALTSKDFRFTMRAWELMSTPSVCTGCSTGCNIEVHHRGGRTWRIIPRESEVNGHWMCDEGRFTYHALTEHRLAVPVVNGLPANWKKATDTAAEKIKSAIESNLGAVGVVFSPHRTNEENYVLARLAKEVWKIDRLYVGGKAPDQDRADDKLRKSDLSPNRRGINEIVGGDIKGAAVLEDDLLAGELKGLIVLGHELPLGEEALAKAEKLDCLVVIADQELGITKRAQVAFAAAAWAENTGSMTNFDGCVQRVQAAYDPIGQAQPAWQSLCALAEAFESTINYDSAQQIFDEMISKVPAFSTAQWGRDLPPVQLRFAHSRG